MGKLKVSKLKKLIQEVKLERAYREKFVENFVDDLFDLRARHEFSGLITPPVDLVFHVVRCDLLTRRCTPSASPWFVDCLPLMMALRAFCNHLLVLLDPIFDGAPIE